MMNLEHAKRFISVGFIDNVICDHLSFSKDEKIELLQMAFALNEPRLVITLLDALHKKPKDLSDSERERYLTLIKSAAIQGNYALYLRLLKDFDVPEGVDIQFYPPKREEIGYSIEHLLKQWESSRHQHYLVLHQSYVRKLHALLKHEPFSHSKHIEMLGFWRANIAAQCGNFVEEKFGILRSLEDRVFMTPKTSYSQYFDRFKGTYPIRVDLAGETMVLTSLEMFDSTVPAWLHTDPQHFDKIFSHIESKIIELQEKCAMFHGEDEEDWTSDVIKNIAEIHWWFAQAAPYHRGSAAVAKIVSEGLFRLAGFEVMGWNTEPDCEALITPTPMEYQENYGRFIKKLSPLSPITLSKEEPSQPIPVNFMPEMLQRVVMCGKCSKEQAQAIMQRLCLSPIERLNTYRRDMDIKCWLFSDDGMIAHALGLITQEEAGKMKTPRHFSLVFSNIGIDFLLRGFITVNQATQFENPDSLNVIFSKNGHEAFLNGLMTIEQLLRVCGSTARSCCLSLVLSDSCVAVMKEGVITLDFILKHFNEDYALKTLLSPPATKLLLSGALTMQDITENIEILRVGNALKDYCSSSMQKSILDSYISKKEAMVLVNARLHDLESWLPRFQAKNIPIIKLIPMLKSYWYVGGEEMKTYLLTLNAAQIEFLRNDALTPALIMEHKDKLTLAYLKILLSPEILECINHGDPPLTIEDACQKSQTQLIIIALQHLRDSSCDSSLKRD